MRLLSLRAPIGSQGVAAQQRGGSHQAAQARCPRVFGGSGGAARLADCRLTASAALRISEGDRALFLALCVRLRACNVRF